MFLFFIYRMNNLRLHNAHRNGKKWAHEIGRINFSAILIEINDEKILSDFIRSDGNAIDWNLYIYIFYSAFHSVC